MKTHTHSWKKYKGTQYYCTHPTCYSKFDLVFLEGKLAECHECHREFVILKGHFNEESLWINCPDCKDKESPLTIDGVRRSIVQLIRAQVKGALHIKLLALNRKAASLNKRESQIQRREIELDKWEKRLAEKQRKDAESLVEKRQALAEWVKKKRNKVAKPKPPKVIESLVEVGDLILKGIDNERIGIAPEEPGREFNPEG